MPLTATPFSTDAHVDPSDRNRQSCASGEKGLLGPGCQGFKGVLDPQFLPGSVIDQGFLALGIMLVNATTGIYIDFFSRYMAQFL